ncbi:hypothetical protein [Domibacillus iocasae]|uniref:Uncharacterized protein n=1 Tax=Domibacillus iocasae TaxID=1714016 RepID=A0A1E7DRZ7_9BACI|nr:hypothetical protein [Domibacillus iocasae]OES45847.1 hypothetical protein BA724_03325 [Domibacillus iocasae]
MVKGKGSIENQGNHNLNNSGDGNTFETHYHYSQPKGLNRSYLYDFCMKFAEIEDDLESYSTEFTTGIDEKMNYNEIIFYKDIFLECDHYYDDVDLILAEIPQRTRILSSIKKHYGRMKRYEKWNDKDDLCELVYNCLYAILIADRNSANIIHEDAETAIHSIMYYALVKCKLLDPIPKVTS